MYNHVADVSLRAFVCSGVTVSFDQMCDGINDCVNGNDEFLAWCESKWRVHIQVQVNGKTAFLLPDKCLLPYYGGCSYTRPCLSSEFDVGCGPCLPGLAEANPVVSDCLSKCMSV